MIDINLIPAVLRKDGKENVSLGLNIPREILLGVGTGLVLLLVTVHLILGALWLAGAGCLFNARANGQKLLPDKTALEAIDHESRYLKKKINVISGMTAGKSVPWSPKFNAISDALPRGLWIRKMTLDKTGLSMEGSAVSKTRNEINDVGLFLAALKQNDGFMEGFSSLEVNSIQRGKTNAVEVTDFTVIAKLK